MNSTKQTDTQQDNTQIGSILDPDPVLPSDSLHVVSLAQDKPSSLTRPRGRPPGVRKVEEDRKEYNQRGQEPRDSQKKLRVEQISVSEQKILGKRIRPEIGRENETDQRMPIQSNDGSVPAKKMRCRESKTSETITKKSLKKPYGFDQSSISGSSYSMEMMNENALPEDGQNYISQQKDKTKKMSKKKQIFTRDQRHILKKWFISHADNPYLKDHSKLELSQKTGLQPRQISNWFTNVRKRIWQPIKNKNQNKSINDLILKVKLRLESDLNSESDAEFQSMELEEDLNQTHKVGDLQTRNSKGQYQAKKREKELDLVNKFNLIEGFEIDNQNDRKLPVFPHKDLIEYQEDRVNQVDSGVQQPHFQESQGALNFKTNNLASVVDELQALIQREHLNKQMQNNNHYTPHHYSSNQEDGGFKNQVMVSYPPSKGERVYPNNPNISANASGANLSFLTHLHASTSGKEREKAELDDQKSKRSSCLNNLSQTAQQPTASIKDQKTLNDIQRSLDGLNNFLVQQNKERQFNPMISLQTQQQHYFMLKDLKNQLEKQFNKPITNINKQSDSIKKIRESNSESGTFNRRTQKQQIKQMEQDESELMKITETEKKYVNLNEESEENKMRIALKQFMKRSKVLRFRDRMSNVRLWKMNSIAYAQKHQDVIENPSLVTLPNYTSPVQVTELCQQQELIEREFKEHERRLNDYRKIEWEKLRENPNIAQHYKYEQNRKEGKMSSVEDMNQKHIEFSQVQREKSDLEFNNVIYPDQVNQPTQLTKGNLKQFKNINTGSGNDSGNCKNSQGINENEEENVSSLPHEAPRDNSNEGEVPLTLPRSKSLSNNKSRSSYQIKLKPDMNWLQSQGYPFYFIPIILVCCPSIIKGKKCSCGFSNYIAANDFYQNQINNYIDNQFKRMGGNYSSNNGNNYQSQYNSRMGGENGGGGSGGSGFADSHGNGCNMRNGSGSNPSNQQSSGQSWQTTAAAALNPLNFINILNTLAFEKQQDIRKRDMKQQPELQIFDNIRSLQQTQIASSNNLMSSQIPLSDQQPIDELITILSEMVKNPNMQNKEEMVLAAIKKYEDMQKNSKKTAQQIQALKVGSLRDQVPVRMDDIQKPKEQGKFFDHLEKAAEVIQNLEKLNQINNHFSSAVLLTEIQKRIAKTNSENLQTGESNLPNLVRNNNQIPSMYQTNKEHQPTMFLNNPPIISSNQLPNPALKVDDEQKQDQDKSINDQNRVQFLKDFYNQLLLSFQLNCLSQNLNQDPSNAQLKGLQLDPQKLLQFVQNEIMKSGSGGSGSGGSADGLGQSGKISGSRTSGQDQSRSGMQLSLSNTLGQQQSLSHQTGENGVNQTTQRTSKTADTLDPRQDNSLRNQGGELQQSCNSIGSQQIPNKSLRVNNNYGLSKEMMQQILTVNQKIAQAWENTHSQSLDQPVKNQIFKIIDEIKSMNQPLFNEGACNNNEVTLGNVDGDKGMKKLNQSADLLMDSLQQPNSINKLQQIERLKTTLQESSIPSESIKNFTQYLLTHFNCHRSKDNLQLPQVTHNPISQSIKNEPYLNPQRNSEECAMSNVNSEKNPRLGVNNLSVQSNFRQNELEHADFSRNFSVVSFAHQPTLKNQMQCDLKMVNFGLKSNKGGQEINSTPQIPSSQGHQGKETQNNQGLNFQQQKQPLTANNSARIGQLSEQMGYYNQTTNPQPIQTVNPIRFRPASMIGQDKQFFPFGGSQLEPGNNDYNKLDKLVQNQNEFDNIIHALQRIVANQQIVQTKVPEPERMEEYPGVPFDSKHVMTLPQQMPQQELLQLSQTHKNQIPFQTEIFNRPSQITHPRQAQIPQQYLRSHTQIQNQIARTPHPQLNPQVGLKDVIKTAIDPQTIGQRHQSLPRLLQTQSQGMGVSSQLMKMGNMCRPDGEQKN